MKNLLKLILIGILCMLFKKSPAQFKITSNDLFLAGTQFIIYTLKINKNEKDKI